ncbi:WS/DGAT/MGAT family O-acyltransferase [Actinomadura flavalba]|uniref:WS/DGAT/MGAT family O-acyltransferase n=1 Tax=Actinomadura flavalba TaxID=1120938 RepID=UPI000374121B|nr:wax ester/triacylglycerol synthase family O-acyltransferase [Actinomadura flavalba]
MSGLDASFYLLEDENTPLHVALVVVFEGPAPSYGDLIRHTVDKLPGFPRYRQRVRSVPLHLGRPVWTDDPHFQILYHVRHTALPAPGSDDQLRNLAGRILGHRLDPAKPLWEMWLVEGLTDGRWALIAKTHHCMVDGVAGMDLATAMFDLTPEYEPPGEPRAWEPEKPPSSLALLADSAQRGVARPLGQLRDIARGTGAVRRAREIGAFARGVAGASGNLGTRAAASLNGPIGPHRRWTWQSMSLDEVREVRKAFGGTVNDVVLTSVAAGFGDLLNARGELRPETIVRSLVPVSMREANERGQLNNRVAAMLVNLPAGEADPLERLRVVRERVDEAKRGNQVAGAYGVTQLTDSSVAPALLSLGASFPLRFRQDLVQTVTTNVPGPDFPLYVMGRRALEMHPYVPLAAGVRVGTAIVSYCGTLYFGLSGDFDAMPDLETLGKGVQSGFGELLALARG